jgi:hypothetical protein
MDAWNDCMSYLLWPDEKMTAYQINEDGKLLIELIECESFRRRMPELFSDLIDCAAFVNQRFIRDGNAMRICIVPL